MGTSCLVCPTRGLFARALSCNRRKPGQHEDCDQYGRWRSTSRNRQDFKGATFEDGQLHGDRVDADVPEAVKDLRRAVYAMLPRIKLTDLWLDGSQWTEFDQQLRHSTTGNPPSIKEMSIMMAALMAMRTNRGLTKMAAAHLGISYRRIAHAAQWQVQGDTLRRCLLAIRLLSSLFINLGRFFANMV